MSFWNICFYLCCLAQWVCTWSVEPSVLRPLSRKSKNFPTKHFNWGEKKTSLTFVMSYKFFYDVLPAVVFHLSSEIGFISHSFIGCVNVCLLYSTVVFVVPTRQRSDIKTRAQRETDQHLPAAQRLLEEILLCSLHDARCSVQRYSQLLYWGSESYEITLF